MSEFSPTRTENRRRQLAIASAAGLLAITVVGNRTAGNAGAALEFPAAEYLQEKTPTLPIIDHQLKVISVGMERLAAEGVAKATPKTGYTEYYVSIRGSKPRTRHELDCFRGTGEPLPFLCQTRDVILSSTGAIETVENQMVLVHDNNSDYALQTFTKLGNKKDEEAVYAQHGQKFVYSLRTGSSLYNFGPWKPSQKPLSKSNFLTALEGFTADANQIIKEVTNRHHPKLRSPI